MSKNTCMRCGAECANGEVMCTSCKQWLEEKKGGAKKPSAFGAKPAPASTPTPAAKAAGGLGGSRGGSKLSRLRGDKPAAAPVEAPAAEVPAAAVEPTPTVQEPVYSAPVDQPAAPVYTPPAAPAYEEIPAAAPIFDDVPAVEEAPAWSYTDETPSEDPTPVAAPSVQEETPVKPAVPKLPKTPGAAKVPGVNKAPKAKSAGASFLPTDPEKRKQMLMMIGLIAAVVVIAIVMVILFGGFGKKADLAPAPGQHAGADVGTSEPTVGDDTGSDPGYVSEPDWDEPTNDDYPTLEPGYVDDGLPGTAVADLAPQVTSRDGGFYFYSYGEDNIGGWYDNSIGGAVSDTDNWCEYWLGGEYEAISGTVYLNYEYRNETARYTDLKIFGDGQLLYQSNVVTAGSRPQSFTLDIRGVRLLRVVIYGDTYLRLSDCRLYENMDDAPAYEEVYEPLGAYIYEGGLNGYDRLYFSAASASSEIENNGRVYWASNAIDGDLTTSWQEDAEDDGIGEFLMLYFDSEVEVEMLCLRLGYATYFDRNGRPSDIEFGFSDGSSITCWFEDVNRDTYVKFSRPVRTSYIKMTIRGVYSGSQWDDTCITEVSAFTHGSGIATPDYQLDEGQPEFLGYIDPWELVGTYSVQCATFSNPDSAAQLADEVFGYAMATNKPWNIYLLYKDPYYVVYFGPYDSKDYATLEKDIFNASGYGEGDAFVVLNKEPEN